MSEPRLASGFWVSAYRARLEAMGCAVYITRRGDAVAGAVMVKSLSPDGQARLWAQEYDLDRDSRAWLCILCGSEAEVDAHLSRALSHDPDLWIVEVETRDGQAHL